MRLEHSCRLVLSLGLVMGLSLGTALPGVAATVSTLTGESLTGMGSGNTTGCPPPFLATYTVSGTAAGPYAGTFTETGSFSTESIFTANFTITSGTTTVTGSKAMTFTGTTQGSISCSFSGTGGGSIDVTGLTYTATIHTPTGNYHDEGVSTQHVNVTASSGAATLTESFTSSLAQPVLIVPTSTDQCKGTAWQNFPQFTNRGQCVSYVETHK
jgi:hypothetical protein